MIRDLDLTLKALLQGRADPGSALAAAAISFDLPDAAWRGGLQGATVNCYLYDVNENLEMRTYEPMISTAADGSSGARGAAPVRINCAYCITAWSTATTDAVLEEHDLLSQTLVALLRSQTIPDSFLRGALAGQIPPYPLVIASQDGIVKHHPQFWTALDQKLKPSLNYVVTLAMFPNGAAVPAPTPRQTTVSAGQLPAAVSPPAQPSAQNTATVIIVEKQP
jgi:hypothetical protein